MLKSWVIFLLCLSFKPHLWGCLTGRWHDTDWWDNLIKENILPTITLLILLSIIKIGAPCTRQEPTQHTIPQNKKHQQLYSVMRSLIIVSVFQSALKSKNLSFANYWLLYRKKFTFCLDHTIYCKNNFLSFIQIFKNTDKPSAENNYPLCRHLIHHYLQTLENRCPLFELCFLVTLC